MDFVDTRCAKGLHLFETDELRPSKVETRKTRQRRATLSAGIRIIQSVIVEIVVTRERAPSRTVGIHPKTSLLVPELLTFGCSGKRGITGVGSRNVLQQ